MDGHESQPQTISIKQFISIATQLAYQACHIIKQASENKSLKKYQKGYNDPVTEADYHVQTMIIKGLAHYFPKLQVIGQETVDYKGQINVQYDKFNFDFCPENGQFEKLSVPYNQVCVWIDPIDCTKGFINGKTEYVTTLIGMSRNKQAYVGIVGTGFKKINQTRIYRPTVQVGVVETKQAFIYDEENKWIVQNIAPLNKIPLITTSRSRVNNLFEGITEHLNGKNVFSGGAGRKIMMVVNGQADLLAYVDSYTCKWDSCAGEAIILAMGGYFLTEKKQPIIYDPKSNDYSNNDGQIVTMSKQLLSKVLEYLDSVKKESAKNKKNQNKLNCMEKQ